MRFYYLTTIIVGILLLVNLAGYQTSLTGGALNAFGLMDSDGSSTISAFKTSTLAVKILGIFGLLAAGAGIVLGAFGRSPDPRYLTAAFVSTILGYLTADLIALFLKIQSFGEGWMTSVGTLIIGATLVALWITALQFWQGSD